MLGYCAKCGLHHHSAAAALACANLERSVTAGEEHAAWLALKKVVATE